MASLALLKRHEALLEPAASCAAGRHRKLTGLAARAEEGVEARLQAAAEARAAAEDAGRFAKDALQAEEIARSAAQVG